MDNIATPVHRRSSPMDKIATLVHERRAPERGR
jgi:hypothetical protein